MLIFLTHVLTILLTSTFSFCAYAVCFSHPSTSIIFFLLFYGFYFSHFLVMHSTNKTGLYVFVCFFVCRCSLGFHLFYINSADDILKMFDHFILAMEKKSSIRMSSALKWNKKRTWATPPSSTTNSTIHFTCLKIIYAFCMVRSSPPFVIFRFECERNKKRIIHSIKIKLFRSTNSHWTKTA